MTTIIAYVPVIHRGYLKFFRSHPEADQIWLLPKSYTYKFRFLEKDIRSLEPEEIAASLQALSVSQKVSVQKVSVLDLDELTEVIPALRQGSGQAPAGTHNSSDKSQGEITYLLPDEEISRSFVEEFLKGHQVVFESVFLRWDTTRSLSENEVNPDETISQSEFDKSMMTQAQDISGKSADWWRQVGAVIIKEGQVLASAFNRHLPHPQEPYIVGDPRTNFHKGEHLEKSTAIHAEAAAIAEAAKKGVALEGASIYVTTFPCPSCAKLIAEAGVSQLYYREGYAVVDGESVLKSANIKISRVD